MHNIDGSSPVGHYGGLLLYEPDISIVHISPFWVIKNHNLRFLFIFLCTDYETRYCDVEGMPGHSRHCNCSWYHLRVSDIR